MTREMVLEMLSGYRQAVGRCGQIQTELIAMGEMLTATICSTAGDVETDEVKALKAGIMEAERELNEKKRLQAYVLAWFKGLGDEREKWLIERQLIDKIPWRTVVPMFEAQFGEHYTKDGLRKMRNRALAKIYQIVGCMD